MQEWSELPKATDDERRRHLLTTFSILLLMCWNILTQLQDTWGRERLSNWLRSQLSQMVCTRAKLTAKLTPSPTVPYLWPLYTILLFLWMYLIYPTLPVSFWRVGSLPYQPVTSVNVQYGCQRGSPQNPLLCPFTICSLFPQTSFQSHHLSVCLYVTTPLCVLVFGHASWLSARILLPFMQFSTLVLCPWFEPSAL